MDFKVPTTKIITPNIKKSNLDYIWNSKRSDNRWCLNYIMLMSQKHHVLFPTGRINLSPNTSNKVLSPKQKDNSVKN